jgi:hypothetical protein
MSRQLKDRGVLDVFCIKFSKVVERYTKYIVVSGFVAIASGRMRGTEDIDMIILPIDEETFSKMHSALVSNGFVAMQSDDVSELFSYLTENISIRYTLKDEPLPEMELKFAKDYLDKYQIKTRIKLPLTGLDIWFSSINMNIAFKEELLKSPKDMEDARHLRIVYLEMVEEAEIKKIRTLIKRYRL